MLVLMAVCALFAVPILLGMLVIGAEIAWAIVSWPFRLLRLVYVGSKAAALWVARRLVIF
jgi:hypothetical protein